MLRFIIGTNEEARRKLLYEHIAEEKSAFLIVPEQFSFESEKFLDEFLGTEKSNNAGPFPGHNKCIAWPPRRKPGPIPCTMRSRPAPSAASHPFPGACSPAAHLRSMRPLASPPPYPCYAVLLPGFKIFPAHFFV